MSKKPVMQTPSQTTCPRTLKSRKRCPCDGCKVRRALSTTLGAAVVDRYLYGEGLTR